MTPTPRIVLCGSSGAGKSSLAIELGRRTGRAVVDVDAAAAGSYADAGAAIAAVGIDRFRERERAVLEQLDRSAAGTAVIVALGGGSVSDAGWRPQAGDHVVWLDIDPVQAWKRIQHGEARPLATSQDALAARIGAQRAIHQQVASTVLDAALPLDILCTQVLEAAGAGIYGMPVLGRGASNLVPLLARSGGWPGVVVVYDDAVRLLGEQLAGSVAEAGVEVLDSSAVAGGSWLKHIGNIEKLASRWSEAGADRRTLVIAVGGGTVLDTAGFAASIYLRGVDWLAVPTSLLAQVDAAIGGKTGVDHAGARNQLGSFHRPSAIVIDPESLDTLPPREIANGMAELWKTALLAGADTWETASSLTPEDVPHGRAFQRALAAAIEHKATVVAGDPFEAGERLQLNFGHTYAHALEAALANGIDHGAAVGLGMLAALAAGERQGTTDPALRKQLSDAMSRFGLPCERPVSFAELSHWLGHDKKRVGPVRTWILLERPGHWRTVPEEGSHTEELAAAWDSLPEGHADQHRVAHPVMILLGVNLVDLGDRPAELYGTETLAGIRQRLLAHAAQLGLRCEIRATDDLARFISAIREARHLAQPLVVNPGAWTHHEPAIGDALEPHTAPVVEVHLTEPRDRESWRHRSVVEPHADHRIAGRGADGLLDALEWIAAQPRAEVSGPPRVHAPAG